MSTSVPRPREGTNSARHAKSEARNPPQKHKIYKLPPEPLGLARKANNKNPYHTTTLECKAENNHSEVWRLGQLQLPTAFSLEEDEGPCPATCLQHVTPITVPESDRKSGAWVNLTD